DPEPSGTRIAVREAGRRAVRGDDRRRELARRGSRRERVEGEEADEHAQLDGGGARAPDPAAHAQPRAGARADPRGRVRRGDAAVDPAAQGRAVGAEAADRGVAREARRVRGGFLRISFVPRKGVNRRGPAPEVHHEMPAVEEILETEVERVERWRAEE